jgi:hypothetical protein
LLGAGQVNVYACSTPFGSQQHRRSPRYLDLHIRMLVLSAVHFGNGDCKQSERMEKNIIVAAVLSSSKSLTVQRAAGTCARIEHRTCVHLGKTLGQLLVDGLQGLAVPAPGGIHLRKKVGRGRQDEVATWSAAASPPLNTHLCAPQRHLFTHACAQTPHLQQDVLALVLDDLVEVLAHHDVDPPVCGLLRLRGALVLGGEAATGHTLCKCLDVLLPASEDAASLQ